MRRIACVIVGTMALFGVLATPAQASSDPIADHALALVGHVWGAVAPSSLTHSAADAALEASR
ncbi:MULTISPECIES: hypothetical protein [Streptomyces]|uniref:Uncharacterized protein n=2 Tax=Streptomyces TaxID=1883 RepID=A0A2N8PA35_STRNR|nr:MULTISPECIES: hypothetical protein [Streptomyces]PNE37887.1 hypothetical protein AOB60_27180 [Streptomyces noursei]SHN21157.1 hypothetical protein SAMN05216268_12427 [Streptomyces yunnanensis]